MSLRERLAARARPTASFHLRVDDDSQAHADLVAAQAVGLPERIATAQAALEACYERLELSALAPADMEALLEAHPPPPDQRESTNVMFNQVTFVPALIAACVVDSDMTEDDWVEFTTKGPVTRGEVLALFNACWDLNHRTPDINLKKG